MRLLAVCALAGALVVGLAPGVMGAATSKRDVYRDNEQMLDSLGVINANAAAMYALLRYGPDSTITFGATCGTSVGDTIRFASGSCPGFQELHALWTGNCTIQLFGTGINPAAQTPLTLNGLATLMRGLDFEAADIDSMGIIFDASGGIYAGYAQKK